MNRICVICGARVTNLNPKVVTCDQNCTIAKDGGITRARAMKMLAAGPSEHTPRVHPSFANRGEQIPNILED